MVLTSKKLIYLLCISFLCSAITEADSPYYQYQCSNHKTFTPGSAYDYDRTRLLHFLSSNATGHTEFYNTTVAGTPGDAVYGSFMCWSDEVLAPQICYRCVNESIQKLLAKCPTSKEAIIWYEDCFVRYSNRYFFSTVDTDPMFRLLNDTNIIQKRHLENFKRLLFETMNETAEEAAKRGLGEKKRVMKEVNISGIGTLFCMSQCTPDLWGRDCRRCLSDAIGNISWLGEIGGRVVYPSCKVRFELYPFYRSYSIPTLPPANSSYLQGKRKDHSSPKTIVVVVVLLSIVAWKQWKEEKWLEIMDSNMIEQESYSDEVIKCIKIGLLCVQENPDVRPSMNTVVQYLSNDSIQLPFPQEPAFFLHGRRMEPTSGQDGSNLKPCSPNELSLKMEELARDLRPSHFLLKIQSYSLLVDNHMESYESGVFEAGGYKWWVPSLT
ncbi:cysteine-rich receptor-like protein kinase 25 [Senna tora]|uniref:Cysteine-rich receptor-like protein kinase 25 n=1 Tax=Senna tora TaxID=362788 RepID=A0A835CFB8_9FABA|nr:cysteine-rich receptor-like protein kinase 25 [Senna tora]